MPGLQVIIPVAAVQYPLRFKPRVGVTASAAVFSNIIQVPLSGAVTVDNGAEFSINGAAFSTTGTVESEDLVQLRVNAPGDVGETTVVSFLVAGILYDSWSVSTEEVRYGLVDNDTYLVDGDTYLTDEGE